MLGAKQDQAVDAYLRTLDFVSKVSGGGSSRSEGQEKLDFRMRLNDVYVVRALDRPEYYRTIMIKSRPLNQGFHVLISNPVYGENPPGLLEVSQQQVFKQMREMNAGMVSGADLMAFPFTGRHEG